jgi:hypothetical protein
MEVKMLTAQMNIEDIFDYGNENAQDSFDFISLCKRISNQKLFLEQAADYFNVPESVISDLADRGIIKTYYINNVKQFKCSEIEEHIINNSIEGGFYE